MSTNYQQLEEKIKELQDEHQKKVNELQAEVDRLKAQEKEDKLPRDFNRQEVLDFLNDFYAKTFDGDYEMESIIQLQKWVILSYQQQYGN